MNIASSAGRTSSRSLFFAIPNVVLPVSGIPNLPSLETSGEVSPVVEKYFVLIFPVSSFLPKK